MVVFDLRPRRKSCAQDSLKRSIGRFIPGVAPKETRQPRPAGGRRRAQTGMRVGCGNALRGMFLGEFRRLVTESPGSVQSGPKSSEIALPDNQGVAVCRPADIVIS